MNSAVDRAKANFIKLKLQQNSRNPKKFWQSIHSLIKDTTEIDLSNIIFKNVDTGDEIERENVPNFLNSYFANVAERTRGPDNNILSHVDPELYAGEYPGFDLNPVTAETVYACLEDIDINMSSCIEGINMNICKILVRNFSDRWAKLFSNSLFLGIFPREWTCSIVTLLPKTGDLTNPGNWRPISQTCIFAKLLERIVHSAFLDYLIRNNIMSEYQFGFLPNRSTQEAVFELTKCMYSTINNRKIMGLVFLDVAKAFNCIHHERLYSKLINIGCSNRMVSWLRSYLDCTQIVNMSTAKSDEIPVCSGIAQGTVLGPLIFIFYINDIISSIKHCRLSMFADDCILYYIGNVFDTMFDKLQTDLDMFIEWCTQNGLKINSGKTKAMITSTRNRLNQLNNIKKLKILGNCIQYVSQYNYLGILLDNEMTPPPLSWGYHNFIKRGKSVLHIGSYPNPLTSPPFLRSCTQPCCTIDYRYTLSGARSDDWACAVRCWHSTFHHRDVRR